MIPNAAKRGDQEGNHPLRIDEGEMGGKGMTWPRYDTPEVCGKGI